MQPVAFVLAGGRSLRMGTDKAALPYGGSTLLDNALTRLCSAGFVPVVCGRHATPAGAHGAIPDETPGLGPLSGLAAGLGWLEGSGQRQALFVPVDVPLLPPVFLAWLWQRACASGSEACVPMLTGRPQPLIAVYAASLAPLFATELAAGRNKVMAALAGCRCDLFHCEAAAAAQGWEQPRRWFANLNTPADVQQLSVGRI